MKSPYSKNGLAEGSTECSKLRCKTVTKSRRKILVTLIFVDTEVKKNNLHGNVTRAITVSVHDR